MSDIFDITLVFSQIPALLGGLPETLFITILSTIFGLIFGLIIALIKINRTPVLNQLCAVFVSFTRGTPMLVQLYLSFFGIPTLLKLLNYYNGTNFNINEIPPLLFVLVTFTLNEAAYSSESIRAAIQSVDKGQIEAAHSLGMSKFQVLTRVILPESFEVALPTLGNSVITLLKGTSLAFVASVVELTAQGKIIAGYNYRYFEVYVSLALIYWALTIIIEQIVKRIEKVISITDIKKVSTGSGKI